jgi:hypothetical protein
MIKKYLFSSITCLSFLFLCSPLITAQDCGDGSNVYSFEFDGRTYQVVKENRKWVDAATCAALNGGKLVEINSALEQAAVFEGVSNASINLEATEATDFEDIAFVWLGGNDAEFEGDWMWDGDNDGSGGLFWVGTTTGAAVGGAYFNWGNDPDNNGDQDGLAMPLTDWPLGTAGQWADLKMSNDLYFVVEYSTILSTEFQLQKNAFIQVSPNPTNGILSINNLSNQEIVKLQVYNMQGQEVIIQNNQSHRKLDLSPLKSGIYVLKVNFENGWIAVKRIVLN